MDTAESFVEMLSGGKRQSIGESNAVAQHVLNERPRAAELWEAIAFADPLVRMRAVDALEKVSATWPEVLSGHEPDVLEDLATAELPEVRWHVGQLIPRLGLDAQQLSQAIPVLERLLDDPSRIVQSNALEGIVRLADRYPQFADRAAGAMARASQSPYPSVRARARRLAH